jgi:hypothetical protein
MKLARSDVQRLALEFSYCFARGLLFGFLLIGLEYLSYCKVIKLLSWLQTLYFN